MSVVQPQLVPELTIAGIKVPLDRGWTDSYENKLQAFPLMYCTHPPVHLWTGGEFKDITIDVFLTAGVHPSIPNAQKLTELVEKVFNKALATKNGNAAVDPVQMTVGSWWGKSSRKFIIRSVTAKWEGPWEEGGRPRSCTLTMVLTSSYQQTGTQATPLESLPVRDEFKW